MSNQTLTWPEMLLLYNMTKQPIMMDKIPEGYCYIVDYDSFDQTLSKDYPYVVVSVDRLDQRTVHISQLPESVRKNWFIAENSYGHGENSIGSFRYFKNGAKKAIIPNPTLEDLKNLIDIFGAIEMRKDSEDFLTIYLNSGNK